MEVTLPRGGFAMKLLKLKLQGPAFSSEIPGRALGDVLMWSYVVKFYKNKVLNAIYSDTAFFFLLWI